MAITVVPISETEFNTQLYNLLKQLEGSEKEPYADKHIPSHPTIGIGFDLTVEPVLKKVFAAMGIAAGSATEAALRSAISNSIGKPTSDVQANLDRVYGSPFVMTDAQINAAFTEIAKSYIKIAQGSGIPYSTELVALTSLTYNAPSLFGAKLKAALALADPYEARAEAWYQIRVVHVPGQNDKRRIAESALFGLYPPGQTVNEDMARAVYRVYTKHSGEMKDYDTQYGWLASEANADLAAAWFAGNAANLENSLRQGAQVLMDKYGQGQTFSPLNIRVTGAIGGQVTAADTGNPNLLIGDNGIDVLTGGNAVDVLVGGEGNDRLRGGKGNDILVGGKGNDTYIWDTGDGSDKIIDEDHQGTIIINGGTPQSLSAAGVFIKQEGANVWKKLLNDGSVLTLTHNSPWTLVMADGSTLQLGETQDSFQDGDFGINLYEEQALSTEFDRTIVGDFSPKDFNLNESGVQTRADDLGNLILDETKPEPGRIDGFNDSAGNDLIKGLGGNDFIYSWRGGDDRIEGGAGDDWMVGGMGKDIVIGGAGNDDIDGDAMANNIMRDWSVQRSVTPTADAISHKIIYNQFTMAWPTAGGDDVIYAGAGEDWVSAGYGNDYVDGGGDADKLWGEGGNDMLFDGAPAAPRTALRRRPASADFRATNDERWREAA